MKKGRWAKVRIPAGKARFSKFSCDRQNIRRLGVKFWRLLQVSCTHHDISEMHIWNLILGPQLVKVYPITSYRIYQCSLQRAQLNGRHYSLRPEQWGLETCICRSANEPMDYPTHPTNLTLSPTHVLRVDCHWKYLQNEIHRDTPLSEHMWSLSSL